MPANCVACCQRMRELTPTSDWPLHRCHHRAHSRIRWNTLANASNLNDWTLDRTGSEISARIHVLTAGMSKGLEYDVVVLVEPNEILADGPGDLYVAMTRPTRRLDVVFRSQLPQGF